MNSREEVLGRIRRALGSQSQAPGTGPVSAVSAPNGPAPNGPEPNEQDSNGGVSRGYRTSGDRTRPELLDLLTERLDDYGSAVRRCGPDEIGAAIVAALADRGARRVVVPPGLDLPELVPVGLPGTGPAEDVQDIEIVVDDSLSTDELDRFDGVITAAAVAIAETGTIVLDGSAGQGRRALSLIPDYHLCIVHDSQVVELVMQSIPILRHEHPLTWISGPSATSDIELDRVQGVHGPRTLEVILVCA
jgi:L-lactate dehydrogenase complex protein LldG